MLRTITHSALEMLCHDTADAIVALDQHGRVCLFNPAAEAAFDLNEREVIGHTLDEYPVLQPLLPLYSHLRAGEDTIQAEITLASGTTSRVQLLLIPGKNEVSTMPEMMREIVHDLKNPLAAAKSFIDLAGAAGPLTEKQAVFAQRAQLSLLSTLNMIHELLDTAWMETNGDLHLIQLDFGNLIRHTVSQLEGYALYRGVQFQVSLPPDGLTIPGDERRLQSAIMNLVGNAVKYSPNGGLVNISVDTEPDGIIFKVEDHGIGIAPEHLPQLFQRFYRVHTSETRRIEGTGLGLAIVKTIIEKHGGTVFVESSPGKGSVFGFSLPQT